jgi:hypothetical protein
MSTYNRPRTRRQLRHPASRSKSHKRDKREGEARQQTQWVGVEAPPRPSPERSFGDLIGHEYICENGTWRRCDKPEEFADYMEKMAELLGWYRSETMRKGQKVEMKRPAPGVEILTTTFSPWVNEWVAKKLAENRDPRKQLAEIRNQWLEKVKARLQGERHLLGYAFHADTSDLHFDLALSRQDGAGGRIGRPGLGLVGPWCVGVDRQQRVGAQISPDKSRQQRRSIANFRHREGEDAVPLDIALARALDEAAEEVIGPELLHYRDAYAARVPELERQHKLAQLEMLQAAEEKLRESLEPVPTPEAEPAPETNPEPEPEMPAPEPDLPPL